ncbi:hypothetical protein TRVA0_027S00584 [Trichomonascus vanleenenianus]|uniref:uncharacterized protein n=1 Tax=Trichomonascus vanleenenianus TaxID=2268995 RepID=UPI003EC9F68B
MYGIQSEMAEQGEHKVTRIEISKYFSTPLNTGVDMRNADTVNPIGPSAEDSAGSEYETDMVEKKGKKRTRTMKRKNDYRRWKIYKGDDSYWTKLGKTGLRSIQPSEIEEPFFPQNHLVRNEASVVDHSSHALTWPIERVVELIVGKGMVTEGRQVYLQPMPEIFRAKNTGGVQLDMLFKFLGRSNLIVEYKKVGTLKNDFFTSACGEQFLVPEKSGKILDQIQRYAVPLQCPFVVVSDGKSALLVDFRTPGQNKTDYENPTVTWLDEDDGKGKIKLAVLGFFLESLHRIGAVTIFLVHGHVRDVAPAVYVKETDQERRRAFFRVVNYQGGDDEQALDEWRHSQLA